MSTGRPGASQGYEPKIHPERSVASLDWHTLGPGEPAEQPVVADTGPVALSTYPLGLTKG